MHGLEPATTQTVVFITWMYDNEFQIKIDYILCRLKKEKEMKWIIHQIYVDETQDFTQAELCLLLRVCHSPNEMFLTGDTAQSIMRGIAFRFNDLRSLFFYAKKSMHAIGKSSGVKVPKKVFLHILTPL